MTRRISITDIYRFADTLAIRRTAKGKVVCYVEGPDDKRWYGFLAGPYLAARIDFVIPSDDFPGLKDGHEGVVKAVAHRQHLSRTEPCFGICDGDALAAEGNAHRLLRSTGVFVDSHETDGNVLYLAYHEIENIIFCETNAIEDALFSLIGRDRYLNNPDKRHQFWSDLNAKAVELLDEAVELFALEVAWREEFHAKASLEFCPAGYSNSRLDQITQSFWNLISEYFGSRSECMTDRASDSAAYRFCMGKELLGYLRTMIGHHDIFLDSAFVAAGSNSFGDAFKARLHRLVNDLHSSAS